MNIADELQEALTIRLPFGDTLAPLQDEVSLEEVAAYTYTLIRNALASYGYTLPNEIVSDSFAVEQAETLQLNIQADYDAILHTYQIPVRTIEKLTTQMIPLQEKLKAFAKTEEAKNAKLQAKIVASEDAGVHAVQLEALRAAFSNIAVEAAKKRVPVENQLNSLTSQVDAIREQRKVDLKPFLDARAAEEYIRNLIPALKDNTTTDWLWALKKAIQTSTWEPAQVNHGAFARTVARFQSV
jgi:hypothetical protein